MAKVSWKWWRVIYFLICTILSFLNAVQVISNRKAPQNATNNDAKRYTTIRIPLECEELNSKLLEKAGVPVHIVLIAMTCLSIFDLVIYRMKKTNVKQKYTDLLMCRPYKVNDNDCCCYRALLSLILFLFTLCCF